MAHLPSDISTSLAHLSRVDSPDSLACWTTTNSALPVTVVIEPAGEPDRHVLETIDAIVVDSEALVAKAAEYLRDELKRGAISLTAADSELVHATDDIVAVPEAVVWSEGSWMVRFGESSLSIGAELGIGVNFVSGSPVSIELLDDDEPIDE